MLSQVHLEKRPLADDINEDSLGRLAFQTQQFVGASLANLVNIAALNAGGAGRDSICYADLERVSHAGLRSTPPPPPPPTPHSPHAPCTLPKLISVFKQAFHRLGSCCKAMSILQCKARP